MGKPTFNEMQSLCIKNKKLLQCNPKYLEEEMKVYKNSGREDNETIKQQLNQLYNQFLGINWKNFCYTYAATTSFLLSCFVLNEQAANNHNLEYYLHNPEIASKIIAMCVFSLVSTVSTAFLWKILGEDGVQQGQ